MVILKILLKIFKMNDLKIMKLRNYVKLHWYGNQKSFIYQFNDDLNEYDYFVNDTNIYAFNCLKNNKTQNYFLYGPNKSGNHFFLKSGLKKIKELN